MEAPVVLIPQRRSRCGKEVKGHPAGNQRQDAKGDIYHACIKHQQCHSEKFQTPSLKLQGNTRERSKPQAPEKLQTPNFNTVESSRAGRLVSARKSRAARAKQGFQRSDTSIRLIAGIRNPRLELDAWCFPEA